MRYRERRRGLEGGRRRGEKGGRSGMGGRGRRERREAGERGGKQGRRSGGGGREGGIYFIRCMIDIANKSTTPWKFPRVPASY